MNNLTYIAEAVQRASKTVSGEVVVFRWFEKSCISGELAFDQEEESSER